MNEAPFCRAETDRKVIFWKVAALWTVSLLFVSLLITLFFPDLVRVLHPTLDSSTIAEVLLVALFSPPTVTILGIGLTVLSYKFRMLCVIPASTITISCFISALFNFPLSTILTFATLVVLVYVLSQNRARSPRGQ